MKNFFTSSIFLFLFASCQATTWTTVSSGFWNNSSVWAGGIVPPYSSSDTFRIKYPVAFENNLFFNSGSLIKIDSTGGLCGHHTISVFTNAKIIKHGILELDSLLIPGGIVTCSSAGSVVLTLSAIISSGGSLSVNGCSFSVGPWFNCIQPEYGFAIGILEETLNNKIRIFPDPSNGMFEISGNPFPEKSQLIIIDGIGRTLYNEPLKYKVENKLIDLSFLENGIYSWIVLSEDKSYGRGKIEIIK